MGRTSTKGKKKNNTSESILKLRETAGILLVLTALFVLVSLIYHSPGDYSSAVFPGNSQVQNKAGKIGAFISYELLFSFGYGSYLLTGFVLLFGSLVFLRIKIPDLIIKLVSLAIFFGSFITLLGLITPETFGEDVPRTMIGYGGLYGHGSVNLLAPRIGRVGTYIVVLIGMILSFMLGTNLLIYPYMKKFLKAAGPPVVKSGKIAGSIATMAGYATKYMVKFLMLPFKGLAWAGKHSYSLTRTGLVRLKQKTEDVIENRRREWQDMIEKRKKEQEERKERERKERQQQDERDTKQDQNKQTASSTMVKEEQTSKGSTRRETGERSKTRSGSQSASTGTGTSGSSSSSSSGSEARVVQNGSRDYALPSPALLEEAPERNKDKNLEMIEDNKNTIEETLKNFGIEGEVVGSSTGPVVTMYELELAPGVKVSKLINRSDDLAIALKAANVRIVFPIPGKSTVGIEIPNAYQGIVRLKELIQEKGEETRNMDIPILLGRSAEGDPLAIDLAQMPHLLVAGTTGSGKSVCLKNILSNQLLFKTPEELKLVLIDPKMVEMSRFRGIPHLVCPIIRDMQKVSRTFEWLVDYMEERYKLLQITGVKDLNMFNDLPEEEARSRIEDRGIDPDIYPGKLPRILVAVDELADLMMVASKEVEQTVTRIAQKARAVGIHMILSTQRPSSDVLTGLIKSNMPARVSFKVMSGVNSRIIIDQNGAENLIGDGDMLLSLPDKEQPIRAQGVLISEDEIDEICDHWKNQVKEQRQSKSLPDIPRISEAKSKKEKEMKENLEEDQEQEEEEEESKERDDLFIDAIDVVVNNDRGSVSLIQRKLGIGYTRAARIMEQIADEGIVGPHRGNKPRKVLIDEDEWNNLKENGQML